MNKGFSLIECVVYILCLTIIFGLLGELVFRFYIRINSDLKTIQQFTNSIVCLNNVIHDLCETMSTEAMKRVNHDTIWLGLKSGEVIWALKEDRLYRYFKSLKVDGGRPNKTASLMMRNVLNFDVVKCLHNNDQLLNSLSGFKIILQLHNGLDNFEHHVAIRGVG